MVTEDPQSSERKQLSPISPNGSENEGEGFETEYRGGACGLCETLSPRWSGTKPKRVSSPKPSSQIIDEIVAGGDDSFLVGRKVSSPSERTCRSCNHHKSHCQCPSMVKGHPSSPSGLFGTNYIDDEDDIKSRKKRSSRDNQVYPDMQYYADNDDRDDYKERSEHGDPNNREHAPLSSPKSKRKKRSESDYLDPPSYPTSPISSASMNKSTGTLETFDNVSDWNFLKEEDEPSVLLTGETPRTKNKQRVDTASLVQVIPQNASENEFAQIVFDREKDSDLERGKTSSRYPDFYAEEKMTDKSRRKKLCCVAFLSIFISLLVSFWWMNGKSFRWNLNLFQKDSRSKDIPSFESKFSTVSKLEDLRDDSKPQYKALQWITKGDPFHLSPTDQRVKSRYIMALFVISAFPGEESEKYLLWHGTRDVCEWYGIKCRFDQKIESIIIDDNGLNGQIPDELAYLRLLKTIDLSQNSLQGTIPENFQTLQFIERLNVANNALEGSIPKNIFESPTLKSLNLANNKINGKIPQPANDIASTLSDVNLSNNLLTGAIPTNLKRLSSLSKLDISTNDLIGNIPTGMESMILLNEFDISNNRISGTIPMDIYKLNLIKFRASENELTGTIPSEVGNLRDLETLHLDGNNLSGEISPNLGSLVILSELHLQYNDLTGSVPNTICDLVHMRQLNDLWVDCGINKNDQGIDIQEVQCQCCTQCFVDRLISREPDIMEQLLEISAVESLESSLAPQYKAARWIIDDDPQQMHPKHVGLVQRYVVAVFGYGLLPPEGKAVSWFSREHECDWFGIICDDDLNVIGIEMPQSNLTGILPPEISRLRSLLGLSLFSNQISGEIPSLLGSSESMSYLDISDNMLTGTTPLSLLTSKTMEFLYLSENSLEGSIPIMFGKNEMMKELWLYGNRLTGSITNLMRSMSSLEDLDVHSNELSGTIPKTVGIGMNMTYLDLSNNEFEGSIPDELYESPAIEFLYLSSNSLKGSISDQIGKLVKLKELGFDGNMLTGSIPLGIGGLNSTEFIYLSENLLTGSIPTTIELLSKSLLYFDASNNMITGTIPSHLYNLRQLKYLMLSTNQLSGTISSNVRNFINMAEFHLDQNLLGGIIPSELTSLEIDVLSLHSNQFVGGLPVLASKFSKSIQWIDMSNNMLTGTIPTSWYSPQNLNFLYLNKNRLTGTLSKEIGELHNLQDLWLSDNFLSGEIPLDIGKMNILEELYLENNEFSGKVSILICNLFDTALLTEFWTDCAAPSQPPRVSCSCCTQCVLYVDARMHRMREIFTSVTDYEYLEDETTPQFNALAWLMTGDNAFHNITASNELLQRYIVSTLGFSIFPPIDSETTENEVDQGGWYSEEHECNWEGIMCDAGMKVTSIQMTESDLEGELPSELSGLSSLTALNIHSNKVTGEIPSTLFELKNLAYVDMSNNKLRSTIPDNVFSSESLEFLYLSNNMLSGEIPHFNDANDANKVLSIEYLDLHSNMLSGRIPNTVNTAQKLSFIDLSDNKLQGEIPSELYLLGDLKMLMLSSNNINGTLSSGIGNLRKLNRLWINQNSLSGSIPAEIGGTNLTMISLYSNFMEGQIPSDIGLLKHLVRLDISRNDFGGEIPTEIGGLSSLEEVYFQKNEFTGSIPMSLCDSTNGKVNTIVWSDCFLEVECSCCARCF